MRALAIVHQPDAGPGVFAEAIEAAGVRLDTWFFPLQERPPLDLREYGAVLSFGGAMHADQEHQHPWLVAEKQILGELVARRVPLLGVCLGAQLLAEAAGAPARRAGRPEIGWYEVETTSEAAGDPLMGPLTPRFDALEWHSYEFPLPAGAVTLAHSELCLQAFRLGESAWGVQFHAEVTADDFEGWLADYRSDPDAVAIGLDVGSLREQTRTRMDDWNDVGRELCRRFITVAREGA